jgi:hypothetical protein
MYQKRNPKQLHTSERKLEAVEPPCDDLPTYLVTLKSKSPLLLGRCSRQLRKSCAATNMMHSGADRDMWVPRARQ